MPTGRIGMRKAPCARYTVSGHKDVVDADLSGYFDTIPHVELMKSVVRRVVDRRVLHLVKMWLDTPVEEQDGRDRKKRTTVNRDTKQGIPQGSPISPLLSNLYMRWFILGWKKAGLEQRFGARIVNYAGDLVILLQRRKRSKSTQRHATDDGPAQANGQRRKDANLPRAGW